ncbi:hypothetical protein GLOIN_2v1824718 [Rhizophagus irregularis DAOM 181602=DAOM 197198]|nr:hypothetical protein GLOIN_2v1824718 [Rhizophagus irregularis DAOM 181602=DAOM 197198]
MNVNQEVDQEVATSQHQEVNIQEVTSSQNKSNIKQILDSKEFGIFKILFNKEENTILQAANVAPGSSSKEEEKVTRARGETIKNQTNKKIIEYSRKRIEKLISLSNREWGIIDAFPNLDINFFKSTTSNAAERSIMMILVLRDTTSTKMTTVIMMKMMID